MKQHLSIKMNKILKQSALPWNAISYGKNSAIVSAYEKSIFPAFVNL